MVAVLKTDANMVKDAIEAHMREKLE